MKIQIDKQVIEQALDALEVAELAFGHPKRVSLMREAITALRSALAESVEQEPVGVVDDLFDEVVIEARGFDRGQKVFFHPATAVPVVEQEPVALYPCGFKELQRLVIKRGAFLAQGLQEDEPITDSLRNAVMDVIGYARDMSDLLAKQPLYPAPAVPEVEQLRDELASALEDLDREVKIGNDLMAENAKYREALEMAWDVFKDWSDYGGTYMPEHTHTDSIWKDTDSAIEKIEEVLK